MSYVAPPPGRANGSDEIAAPIATLPRADALPLSSALRLRAPRPSPGWAVLLIVILLPLRALYIDHLHFNTDEAQHLHLVWAWTKGLVQYRDLADNHAPLFYLLWSTWFRWWPQDGSALLWARWSMVPIDLAMIAGAYFLSRPLYGRRAAGWTAAAVAAWPSLFRLTAEFRPDQLWMLLWVVALLVATSGPWTVRRGALFGLILGTAFTVSMKTSVLTVSFLGAIALTRWLAGPDVITPRPLQRLKIIAAIALCVLIAPAAVVLEFARLGALHDLYAGVIGSNLIPELHRNFTFSQRALLFVAVMSVAVFTIRRCLPRRPLEPVQRRQLLLLCTAVVTTVAFKTVWPLFARQDWLPVLPPLIVSIVGAICVLHQTWPMSLPASWQHWLRAGLIATIVISLLMNIAAIPYRSDTGTEIASINDMLRLTDAGQHVVDMKGKFVFRERAPRAVFETLTRDYYKAHPDLDRGPEEIIAAHAFVTELQISRFSPRTRNFLLDHFISVGSVAVAGHRLPPCVNGESSFAVQLATTYDVVTPHGPATGWIDGQPLNGPVAFSVGDHHFRADGPSPTPVAIVWHQATERGFAVDWGNSFRSGTRKSNKHKKTQTSDTTQPSGAPAK